MKRFICTSDKYVNIVADHGKLYNKFSSEKREIDVLGFRPPSVKYPENYTFVSMGEQSDFPNKDWASPILPFINAVEDKCFEFWWDDMFPIRPFREDLYEEGARLVEDGKAQKVHFFMGSREQYYSCKPYNDNFMVLSQTAEYRSGLPAAFWDKEYFLKNIEPGMTPWEYEIYNQPKMLNDGAVQLIPKNEPIVGWVNMFRQGKFNDWMWNNYKNSETGHFAWNKFQKLTPDVAEIVGSYEGKVL